jgi:hypothetical protein
MLIQPFMLILSVIFTKRFQSFSENIVNFVNLFSSYQFLTHVIDDKIKYDIPVNFTGLGISLFNCFTEQLIPECKYLLTAYIYIF